MYVRAFIFCNCDCGCLESTSRSPIPFFREPLSSQQVFVCKVFPPFGKQTNATRPENLNLCETYKLSSSGGGRIKSCKSIALAPTKTKSAADNWPPFAVDQLTVKLRGLTAEQLDLHLTTTKAAAAPTVRTIRGEAVKGHRRMFRRRQRLPGIISTSAERLIARKTAFTLLRIMRL